MNELSERIKNDPLAMAILSIMKVMEIDYRTQFTKNFPNEQAIKEFRRRLYKKLEGLKISSIIDGYEAVSSASPDYCPNLLQIVEGAIALEKETKRIEKNKEEAARVSALPPPKPITCNPIQMLKEARARIEAEESGMTKAEKWARHLERLEAHNVLIAAYEAKKRYDASKHLCSAGFCNNPGTMSHSTTGSSNYYCVKHFRRA